MKRFQFLSGFLCATLLLCAITSVTAAGFTAVPGSQEIYVDGQRVSMTAYAIGENNYVKLRDVGEAVGFNVYWDGSAVQIESGKPYTGTAPDRPAPQLTPTPQAVTEESVQAVLAGLREQYPHGTLWPSPYRSTSGGPYGTAASNCAGWATLCSDAAFGDLPWRRVDNPSWDQIRIGDLVEYDNDLGGHVIVVVKKTDDALSFTDSGRTQKAYWGGQYPRWWLEQQPGLILYTRYPE